MTALPIKEIIETDYQTQEKIITDLQNMVSSVISNLFPDHTLKEKINVYSDVNKNDEVSYSVVALTVDHYME
jgi:hypothetical protein